MAENDDDGTAWLGIELSMEGLYAEQFKFTKGLVCKVGDEFTGVNQHLAKHDEFQGLIDELIVQQQKQDELRKSLENTVTDLSAQLVLVPGKIAAAVDAAMADVELKFAHMRDQMTQQSQQVEALETLEIAKVQKEKKVKAKKSNFWETKKTSVMSELRAATVNVAGHMNAVRDHPEEDAGASVPAAADAPAAPAAAAPAASAAPAGAAPAGISSSAVLDMPELVMTEPVHQVELEKSKSMRNMNRQNRPSSRGSDRSDRGARTAAINEAMAAVEEAAAAGDEQKLEQAKQTLSHARLEGHAVSSNDAINEILADMVDEDVSPAPRHAPVQLHSALRLAACRC